MNTNSLNKIDNNLEVIEDLMIKRNQLLKETKKDEFVEVVDIHTGKVKRMRFTYELRNMKRRNNMAKEVKFEEKLQNLEEIVKELEEGNVDLDDAINKYTEAMKIAKECSEKLDNATKAVNKILSESGELEDFKEMEVKE